MDPWPNCSLLLNGRCHFFEFADSWSSLLALQKEDYVFFVNVHFIGREMLMCIHALRSFASQFAQDSMHAMNSLGTEDGLFKLKHIDKCKLRWGKHAITVITM